MNTDQPIVGFSPAIYIEAGLLSLSQPFACETPIMNIVKLTLAPALLAGFVATASAHTDTALANSTHFSGHLFEATVIGLAMLAVAGGLRAWSKRRR